MAINESVLEAHAIPIRPSVLNPDQEIAVCPVCGGINLDRVADHDAIALAMATVPTQT